MCPNSSALGVSQHSHSEKVVSQLSNPVLLLPKVVLHRGFSSLIQPQLNEAKGTVLIWMNSWIYLILWWCCHKKRFASAQPTAERKPGPFIWLAIKPLKKWLLLLILISGHPLPLNLSLSEFFAEEKSLKELDCFAQPIGQSS